jgi:signal transduction histidine kinase
LAANLEGWGILRASLRDVPFRLACNLAVIVDINATVANDERFRANRFDLVSSLADDLAHEIKNPLNSIIVNLEVLKVRLARSDTEAALGRALVVEEEVRRLHQLIDRMLMLLRPDREEASNLPLDSALDELIPLIHAQTRLARNEFHYDCAATVFVAVQRDTLKFALLNLILATHARLGDGGGGLSIRCTPDDDTVHLIIEALGTGNGSAVGAPDSSYESAIAMARALLSDSGARIEKVEAGVSLTLPRSASV